MTSDRSWREQQRAMLNAAAMQRCKFHDGSVVMAVITGQYLEVLSVVQPTAEGASQHSGAACRLGSMLVTIGEQFCVSTTYYVEFSLLCPALV
jgi:hypothetical protein